MTARPQFWGWSTSPRAIAFWGWESAHAAPVSSPKVVHARELQWAGAHHIPDSCCAVNSSQPRKAICDRFDAAKVECSSSVARVVCSDSVFSTWRDCRISKTETSFSVDKITQGSQSVPSAVGDWRFSAQNSSGASSIPLISI